MFDKASAGSNSDTASMGILGSQKCRSNKCKPRRQSDGACGVTNHFD